MILTLCKDSTINFGGIFDTSFAPTLLYYSYIPILIVSLFFTIFVLIGSRFSVSSKILAGLSISFCIWILNEIVQWISAFGEITMFSWQIIALIQLSIFYFSLIFIYYHVNNRISAPFLTTLSILALSVLVLVPTRFNIESFDFVYCEGYAGFLWNYIYILEIISILWIIYSTIRNWQRENNPEKRKQNYILYVGSIVLLSIFLVINVQIEGDNVLFLGFIPVTGFLKGLLGNYEINLIGPIGMVAFLAFLSAMIVRFKAFNIKLLSTQVFVWAVVILIGSQFFFIQSNINKILNAITLVATSVLGLIIIRGVKKEIALREDLAISNENQQLLIRFITHQVKGFFTKSKAIFAGMLDGDFGSIDENAKLMAREGLDSDNKAVNMVQEVLSASSLRNGTTQFNFEKTNLSELTQEIANDFTKIAQEKGIEYQMNITDSLYAMVDKMQISQVIKNLIDNSVKYTKSGSVIVSLQEKKINRKDAHILFSVKDTGVGLSDGDKKVLFTEGGRGEESLRLNVNSTGYGLYIVKKIVDGHKGNIWAESAGREKGATFFVEIEEMR